MFLKKDIITKRSDSHSGDYITCAQCGKVFYTTYTDFMKPKKCKKCIVGIPKLVDNKLTFKNSKEIHYTETSYDIMKRGKVLFSVPINTPLVEVIEKCCGTIPHGINNEDVTKFEVLVRGL